MTSHCIKLNRISKFDPYISTQVLREDDLPDTSLHFSQYFPILTDNQPHNTHSQSHNVVQDINMVFWPWERHLLLSSIVRITIMLFCVRFRCTVTYVYHLSVACAVCNLVIGGSPSVKKVSKRRVIGKVIHPGPESSWPTQTIILHS